MALLSLITEQSTIAHHSLIPWGSFRGRQEEKWVSFRGQGRFGDHFGVGIISGAVQFLPKNTEKYPLHGSLSERLIPSLQAS